jgi:hypothetical protein
MTKDLEYQLPTPLKEAINSARAALEQYVEDHGDSLLPPGEAAERLIADVLTWALFQGQDYESTLDAARRRAEQITRL